MEVSKDEFLELRREVGKVGHSVTAMEVEIRNLRSLIGELVSKAEFFPVKVIAYSLAAGSMGAVLTAVINNVVSK